MLEQGERFDLIIMDENFGVGHIAGSKIILKLRATIPADDMVIVSCSGNYMSRDGMIEGADAMWGKPFPDWRDGSMQRQLLPLLARLGTKVRAKLG